MKFFTIGSITAASIGGVSIVGYNLSKSSGSISKKISDYQPSELVSWEYYMRGDQFADSCEREFNNPKTLDQGCNKDWSNKIKNHEEKVNLLIYANKNGVNDLLDKKLINVKDLDALKKWGKEKCETFNKPKDKILIICK